MAYIFDSTEFVRRLYNVATNYKTLYVSGCFGAPMTDDNKKRYSANNSYNRQPARTKMIQAASSDTFGFDCNNLIKGILWGWTGNISDQYGGAKYITNGVPDVGETDLLNMCYDISSTGWADMLPGELVWMAGHVGAYVGDGKVVECSPKWRNGVQVTAIKNVPHIPGLNERVWVKHGKLPWINYIPEKEVEEEVTYEQWKAFMDQYRKELAELPPSGWIEKSREWEAAQQMGIVSEGAGRPRDLATREEVAAMMVRAVK